MTITMRTALLLGLVLAYPLVAVSQTPPAAASQAARTLTPDDLFAIRSVGDPQLSPEGKWIAYTVSALSADKDKAETQIWMIAVEGGDAIPMTATGYSASRPRWSPDGKYLTFLASKGGDEEKAQVWALNRSGGEGVALTSVTQEISSYEWSPDAGRLLLAMKDPEEKADTAKGKKKTAKPWVI